MGYLKRERSFVSSVILCALSLSACKPGIFRPFKKNDDAQKTRGVPTTSSPTSPSARLGTPSTPSRSEGGHARSEAPESSAPAIPEGPVSLIPISDQVSKNLFESLKTGIPKGVDCNSPQQAATIDCHWPLKSASYEKYFDSFKLQLIQKAFAASNLDYVMTPDRSVTRSQLLSTLEKNDAKNDALKSSFQKISSMHIFSNKAGWLFQDFEFVIAFSNQKEIWARGNSDVKLACDTISSLFPKDGKDFFKLENIETGERVSFESPTHGKFCSADSLSKYRIINLEVTEGFRSVSAPFKAPSLVVLLAREESKMPSYLVQIGSTLEKDFWGLLSQQIFSAGAAIKK